MIFFFIIPEYVFTYNFLILQTVSIKHAEIEAQSANGTIFIRDLNSSNKTRINKVNIN